jgi:hypothetical protein
MAIFLKHNPYTGINAHLNSYLQNTKGMWRMFHSAHIDDIARMLDQNLPDNYEVGLERSLQLAFDYPDSDDVRVQTRVPDVTIYDAEPRPSASGTATAVATVEEVQTQTYTLAMTDTLYEELEEDEHQPTGITINEVNPENGQRNVVTRLELLSPANKPPHSGYGAYREKRYETLLQGIPLVEIDYLHETPPAVLGVPEYTKRLANSYPFYIAVSYPKPTLEQGVVVIYGFNVNKPLPRVLIPLRGEETILFDFDPPYQRTFSSFRSFSKRLDYAEAPRHFERYATQDRAEIEKTMLTAAKPSPDDATPPNASG